MKTETATDSMKPDMKQPTNESQKSKTAKAMVTKREMRTMSLMRADRQKKADRRKHWQHRKGQAKVRERNTALRTSHIGIGASIV